MKPSGPPLPAISHTSAYLFSGEIPGSTMGLRNSVRKGPSARIFAAKAIRRRVLKAAVLLLPRYPVGAGQRHLRHRGRFYGERYQIVRLEVVDIGLTACPRNGSEFHRERLEVVGHPPRAHRGIKAALEFWILCGHAHRTHPG